MTKEQCLDIIKLLSALEAASFGLSKDGGRLPDYLYEHITTAIETLSHEVLNK